MSGAAAWKPIISDILKKNKSPQKCEASTWSSGGGKVIYYPRGSCDFDMQKVTLESAISQGVKDALVVRSNREYSMNCKTSRHFTTPVKLFRLMQRTSQILIP